MKTIFLLLALVSGAALATPGGVDANGCHTPKNGVHHCHALKSEKLPAHESARARNARMKAQCQGLPNAGACLGYGHK